MNARVATLLQTARHEPGRVLILAGLLLALVGVPLLFSHELYDNFTLPKQSGLLIAAALVLVGGGIDGRLLPAHRWLRALLLAWVAALILSWALGIDPVGSVLGYYQYRQGLLTQLSCAALFAAAVGAAGWLPFRALAWPAAASLVVVAVYAGVQTSGHDAFSWWIDASSRAISTIGNANELAAYAVIALAFAGGTGGLGRRWAVALELLIATASGFIVFAAQSRSGLGALGIVVVALGAIGLAQRWGVRRLALKCGTLGLGILAGFLLAGLVGSSGSAAGRVEAGIAKASDPAASTRVQLWRGTAATFAASPLVGFGPDGLYKAFPMHRPADLHGAFDGYDLVAQSSHNWLLDTAANTGVIGVAALGGLVGAAVLRAVRPLVRPRGKPVQPETAQIVAAMAGYLAITMANPLSLAAHATFFILLGFVAGRSLPEPEPELGVSRVGRPLRLVLAAPVAVALGAIGVLLPIADVAAQHAWERYAHEQFADAAREARHAAELMPLEQAYQRREADAWLAAGARGDRGALARAEDTLLAMDDRFGLNSNDTIALATARIGLGEPATTVDHDIDRALARNPHGVFIAWYTERLHRAASGGAILHYDSTDDWVRVDFPGDVALP